MAEGILSIDPGALSGWSIYPPDSMRPCEWGKVTLRNKDSAKKIREVVEKAVALGVHMMVIEGPYPVRFPKKTKPGEKKEMVVGWRTMYGLGTARGRWDQEALAAGMKIEEIHPSTWQARMIGRGKRDRQVAMYIAKAEAIVKEKLNADTAAAICIGDYWIRRAGGIV